ncbi:MAG: hypothetical protein ACK6DX_01870 [Acidobacteriota bacterium]
MTQSSLLLHLLEEAIQGIEDGRIERLLDAQLAIYGLALAAQPVRTEADDMVSRVCEYCLDCLSHGERDREWGAASVLAEFRSGLRNFAASRVGVEPVGEILNYSA